MFFFVYIIRLTIFCQSWFCIYEAFLAGYFPAQFRFEMFHMRLLPPPNHFNYIQWFCAFDEFESIFFSDSDDCS